MRRALAAAFFLISLLLAGPTFAATSYRVTNGTTSTISEWGHCRKVTNNVAGGNDLFVPTKTSTEWTTFISNAPAGVSLASCNQQVIFLTSGSSWTVPADWNNSANTIDTIGGGGSGGYKAGTSGARLSTGGGGGGWGRYTNLALTPGAGVSYHVGAGGAGYTGTSGRNGNAGEDTYFNGTSYASASVGGQGGGAGLYASSTGGAGGGGIGPFASTFRLEHRSPFEPWS